MTSIQSLVRRESVDRNRKGHDSGCDAKEPMNSPAGRAVLGVQFLRHLRHHIPLGARFRSHRHAGGEVVECETGDCSQGGGEPPRHQQGNPDDPGDPIQSGIAHATRRSLCLREEVQGGGRLFTSMPKVHGSPGRSN